MPLYPVCYVPDRDQRYILYCDLWEMGFRDGADPGSADAAWNAMAAAYRRRSYVYAHHVEPEIGARRRAARHEIWLLEVPLGEGDILVNSPAHMKAYLRHHGLVPERRAPRAAGLRFFGRADVMPYRDVAGVQVPPPPREARVGPGVWADMVAQGNVARGNPANYVAVDEMPFAPVEAHMPAPVPVEPPPAPPPEPHVYRADAAQPIRVAQEPLNQGDLERLIRAMPGWVRDAPDRNPRPPWVPPDPPIPEGLREAPEVRDMAALAAEAQHVRERQAEVDRLLDQIENDFPLNP